MPLPQLNADVLSMIVHHAALAVEADRAPTTLAAWRNRAAFLQMLSVVSRAFRAAAQFELAHYIAVTADSHHLVLRAAKEGRLVGTARRVLLHWVERSPYDPRTMDSLLEQCDKLEELESVGAKWSFYSLKRARSLRSLKLVNYEGYDELEPFTPPFRLTHLSLISAGAPLMQPVISLLALAGRSSLTHLTLRELAASDVPFVCGAMRTWAPSLQTLDLSAAATSAAGFPREATEFLPLLAELTALETLELPLTVVAHALPYLESCGPAARLRTLVLSQSLNADVLSTIVHHAALAVEADRAPTTLDAWRNRVAFLRMLSVVSRAFRTAAQFELAQYIAVTADNHHLVLRAANEGRLVGTARRVLLHWVDRSSYDPRTMDSLLEQCDKLEELESVGAKWSFYSLKGARYLRSLKLVNYEGYDELEPFTPPFRLTHLSLVSAGAPLMQPVVSLLTLAGTGSLTNLTFGDLAASDVSLLCEAMRAWSPTVRELDIGHATASVAGVPEEVGEFLPPLKHYDALLRVHLPVSLFAVALLGLKRPESAFYPRTFFLTPAVRPGRVVAEWKSGIRMLGTSMSMGLLEGTQMVVVDLTTRDKDGKQWWTKVDFDQLCDKGWDYGIYVQIKW
ncbi:hypothetical protein JCM10450v2_004804 [Rhodotorula kratochvilovae]